MKSAKTLSVAVFGCVLCITPLSFSSGWYEENDHKISPRSRWRSILDRFVIHRREIERKKERTLSPSMQVCLSIQFHGAILGEGHSWMTEKFKLTHLLHSGVPWNWRMDNYLNKCRTVRKNWIVWHSHWVNSISLKIHSIQSSNLGTKDPVRVNILEGSIYHVSIWDFIDFWNYSVYISQEFLSFLPQITC